MLKASDILGYELDLTNFPVKQDFDSLNLDEIRKKILAWEKTLVYSQEFKEYVLAVILNLVTKIENGWKYKIDKNIGEIEVNYCKFYIKVVLEEFYISNNILDFEEQPSSGEQHLFLNVQIPLENLYLDKWNIEVYGVLAPEYGDVPYVILSPNEILNFKTFCWSKTFENG
jgi:hypothetical protein